MTSNSTISSLRNRTRAKFDALIRTNASGVAKSTEKLLVELESTSASSENLSDKSRANEIELSVINEQNKSFILNKFFQNHESAAVKPPVPKPRTKISLTRTVSQATFDVTSPKFVRDESPPNNGTYNVEEVGDVLIHESPLKPKVVVKDVKDVVSSDNESTESNVSRAGIRQKQALKGKEVEKDEDESNAKTAKYNYEQIVEVIVHRTDRLELNSLVVHPIVKMHVVDIGTGKYFPKSDKSRSVVFFYENNDNDYISPVMTHTFNLQEQRALYPVWEEAILLNDDYEYFKKERARVILFFEILDFVSFAALHHLSQKERAKGWHGIAFAFLKLAGKNNSFNVGKKMKLQLYYPQHVKKSNSNVCGSWVLWKKKKLLKYPSVLYVSINRVVSTSKIVETGRSKTPVQRESSSRTKLFGDALTAAAPGLKAGEEMKETHQLWSKSPFDKCQPPNKCLAELNSYDKGCFVMKFSRSGLYLACGVETDSLFSVVVYSVISLMEIHKLPVHQALIYQIKWSTDDSFLVTASGDNTIAIITLSPSVFQILPHPSFVYCCDISGANNVIASGCFDGIVRLWIRSQASGDFQLFQELEGHQGYITTLCLSTNLKLFTADSLGVIIEWFKEESDWILRREFNLLDLRETPINQLIIFSKEKRLVVHSRDSTIRIVDVRTGCVLQWLRGGLNKKLQIFGAISSCGSLVYSGSEDGVLHVWNAKSGLEVASYKPFASHGVFSTIHCVETHPYDDVIALSHFGTKSPVLIYVFDKWVTVDGVIRNGGNEEVNNGSVKVREKRRKSRVEDVVENEGRFDFKAVLQKMDSMIVSRKSDK